MAGRKSVPPKKPAANAKFLADGMLGSLARKTRAFGFDTVYLKDTQDKEMTKKAKSDRRILLTADRALASFARDRGVATFLLSAETDAGRLKEIRVQASAEGVPLVRGDSLCSLCNGKLEPLGPEALEGDVPEEIRAHHKLFFRCEDCGHVYWRGEHWKKLRRLGAVFDAKVT